MSERAIEQPTAAPSVAVTARERDRIIRRLTTGAAFQTAKLEGRGGWRDVFSNHDLCAGWKRERENDRAEVVNTFYLDGVPYDDFPSFAEAWYAKFPDERPVFFAVTEATTEVADAEVPHAAN